MKKIRKIRILDLWSLLRVTQSPQNPAMGVLKSPGTPFTACVRRAFWRYHYLRVFSGVDTGAPGIISDWCIYGIRAVYGFFSRLRATPVVVGHRAGTCWVIFPAGNGADWATFPADSVYQPRDSRPLVGGTGGNGHWCVGELISR